MCIGRGECASLGVPQPFQPLNADNKSQHTKKSMRFRSVSVFAGWPAGSSGGEGRRRTTCEKAKGEGRRSESGGQNSIVPSEGEKTVSTPAEPAPWRICGEPGLYLSRTRALAVPTQRKPPAPPSPLPLRPSRPASAQANPSRPHASGACPQPRRHGGPRPGGRVAFCFVLPFQPSLGF